jgi:hypothetical protein
VSTAALASELVERYSPSIEVPPPAVLDQVRRNAQLRTAMLQEFGAVDARELADLVGSKARNRLSTVDNWRRAGRVIVVPWHGRALVPGFQLLADGSPDPGLRPVLRILDDQGFGPWEQALWWVVPAPRLEGARPVDLLLRAREMTPEGAEQVEARLVHAAVRPRDWF